MNEIHVETDYDAYYPGTDILVTVTWDFDRKPDAIELRLTWSTSGKGTRDIASVSTYHFVPESMAGTIQRTHPLPWGPYSFSGKLVSLIWAVEAVALPKEQSARKEFVMGPGAREVLIGPARENASA